MHSNGFLVKTILHMLAYVYDLRQFLISFCVCKITCKPMGNISKNLN